MDIARVSKVPEKAYLNTISGLLTSISANSVTVSRMIVTGNAAPFAVVSLHVAERESSGIDSKVQIRIATFLDCSNTRSIWYDRREWAGTPTR